MRHERLARVGLAAAIVLPGCADRAKPSPTTTTRPETIFGPTAVVRTTTTVDNQPSVEKRMAELWKNGIYEVRDKFSQTGEITVKRGVCAVWDSNNRRVVTVNPGYYERDVDGHKFSFLIFTDPPLDGPKRDKLTLMNGSYLYTKLDPQGRLEENTGVGLPHFLYSFEGKPLSLYAGEATTVNAEVVQHNNGQLLKDKTTGTPVVVTRIFGADNKQARVGELGELCKLTATSVGIETA